MGVVLILTGVGLLGWSTAASAQTTSFTTPGCSLFTVPPKVTSITMTAIGGAVAQHFPEIRHGDEVSATVAVSPGQMLDVCVGVGGGQPGTGTSADFEFEAGAGGGGSGVSRGSDFSTPVLVAGGAAGQGGGSEGEDIGGGTILFGAGGFGGGAGMAGSPGGSTPPSTAGAGGTVEGGASSTSSGPGVGAKGGDGKNGGGAGGGGGGGYVGGGGGEGGSGKLGGGGGGAGGTDFCGGTGVTCATPHVSTEEGSGRVTFTYTPAKDKTTTAVKCEPPSVVAGQATTCTATVTDAESSGASTPTGTVTFSAKGKGSFSKMSCTLSGSGSSASCAVTYTPGSTPAEPLRSDTIAAEYGGDEAHEGSEGTTVLTVISPTALAHGSFVIGDRNATIGANAMFYEVQWWGSEWWKRNSLSGGPAPAAFKGFAESSPNPPTCGEKWTTKTGSGSAPPATVPEYMEVIAASKITQSGSTITGNAPEVVVVKTNPGYGPSPGHRGTGKVIAIVCKT